MFQSTLYERGEHLAHVTSNLVKRIKEVRSSRNPPLPPTTRCYLYTNLYSLCIHTYVDVASSWCCPLIRATNHIFISRVGTTIAAWFAWDQVGRWCTRKLSTTTSLSRKKLEKNYEIKISPGFSLGISVLYLSYCGAAASNLRPSTCQAKWGRGFPQKQRTSRRVWFRRKLDISLVAEQV